MGRNYQHTTGAAAADERDAGKRDDAKTGRGRVETEWCRPVHALPKRERRKGMQGISEQRGHKPAKTL